MEAAKARAEGKPGEAAPPGGGMQNMLKDMIKAKMKETFENKYKSSLDNIKK